MIRKTLLRCALAGLFLVGIGLASCSDDTQRVVTGSGTGSIESLATDTDWPTTGDDNYYDSYPYPEELTDDEVMNDFVTPDERFDDDFPSGKPRDNELIK